MFVFKCFGVLEKTTTVVYLEIGHLCNSFDYIQLLISKISANGDK